MALSTEFWIQIIIYAISTGSLTGTILTRLHYIEKKQDENNNLIVRMAIAEQSLKTLHSRMDRRVIISKRKVGKNEQ